MRRLFAAAVLVLALSVPGLASALVYSPTLSDLAGWQALQGSVTQFYVDDLSPYYAGVKFTGNLHGFTSEPSQGYEWIGLNNINLDLSSYDSFALQVTNKNENTWHYGLYVADSNWNMAASIPWFASVDVGTSAVLKVDLAALASQVDLTDIVSIGLVIEQTVPILTDPANPDRTFETIVAPVPEPGTMMLLGAGFLGLAIYGKRRKNA